MSRQTHFETLMERTFDMVLAFTISTWVQITLVESLGIGQVSVGQSMYMVAIFTAISFVRGYAVRRLFDWHKHKKGQPT